MIAAWNELDADTMREIVEVADEMGGNVAAVRDSYWGLRDER